MEPKLLDYYNRELRYLRELGGEFARDFPKVAGRLGLDAFECADPYVERLLEGFAFLTARVQMKIDAEFPRFTEQILEMLCPHYLGPTPSMAVVQLKPDPQQGALVDGFVVPRGTTLASNVRRGEATACEYRTAHDVTLWPVELTSLAHTAYTGDLPDLGARSARPVKGAIRMRLRTTNGMPFAGLRMDKLSLFVRGGDAVSIRFFELLLCGALGVAARGSDARAFAPVRGASVRPLGLEDAEALLPCGARAFHGYRLLHEYFAFPSRFLFGELAEIGPALRGCVGHELEIAVAVDRHDASVEAALGAANLALFCTPAINLFPKKADRIHLSDRDREYHVIPDRARPMDFETHSILDVTGFGAKGDMRREFVPFYTSRAGAEAPADAGFFTVQRRARQTSSRARARGPRSSYLGSEVFVALVDGRDGPYRSDLKQLGVGTLCTNRDLPLRMSVGEGRTDFFVESGAPVESVRCVAGPSPPRASHAIGETNWRLISHLSLNYLSLIDGENERGAAALRELLELYGDLSEPGVRRQIDGIRSAVGRPIVRRLPGDGPVTFGRGIEVTVDCDEAAFEGTSVALLGMVLDRFFGKYVSINSFVETALRSPQRGEIVRWPPKIGLRPTI